MWCRRAPRRWKSLSALFKHGLGDCAAGCHHGVQGDGRDGESDSGQSEGDIGYPVSERLLGHVPYLSCLLSLGDWTFFAIREALKEMRPVDIRVGDKFRVAALEELRLDRRFLLCLNFPGK